MIPAFDFETYSEAGYYWDEAKNKWRAPEGFPSGKPGLPSIGAARYAEHPTTEVLCLYYNLKDGDGKQLWVPGMPHPAPLFEHLKNGGLIEAFNVQFEYFVWHYVCTLRLGWPELPIGQLRCAQAKSAAHGMPPSLAKTAEVLGTMV